MLYYELKMQLPKLLVVAFLVFSVIGNERALGIKL